MKIKVVENYAEMSEAAALIIAEQLKAKPDSVLGLATGSSPLGTYKKLIEYFIRGEISFKNVRTVNLDEYCGLGEESPDSYVSFMRKNLFSHTDINLAYTHIPDGRAQNPQEECSRYNEVLDGLPRDIQLLGLGSDGHIGFNEPNTPFNLRTHVTELAESTVKDNSRLFASLSEVPRKAITMGIADIMRAKQIILLACGANKAEAVRAMVKGKVDEACPASVLQRHSDTLIILDGEAAKLI